MIGRDELSWFRYARRTRGLTRFDFHLKIRTIFPSGYYRFSHLNVSSRKEHARGRAEAV